MSWFYGLFNDVDSVPHALFVLSLCATLGAAIGNIRVRGIQLGAAGVLFAGLVFGHFGITLNHHVLDFVRDFGLSLFVYMVGLSVGPGFFSSLRTIGLKLNILALSVVFIGAIITLGISYFFNVDIAAAVGIFCGATTNTPSLGAATQLLSETLGSESLRVKLPGLGYAVSYPLGVIGIIFSLLLIKWITRSNIDVEAKKFNEEGAVPNLLGVSLKVSNPNIQGTTLQEILNLMGGRVTLARIQHGDQISPAIPSMTLNIGDVVHAVGTEESLKQAKILIGGDAAVNLTEVPCHVVMRTFIVTSKNVIDETLGEIALHSRFGVSVTRVTRGEVELLATTNLRLRFGDIVRVVGELDAMDKVEATLGNSKKKLRTPDLLPVFLGLSIGIVLGTFPIPIPGIASPVKLGLAAGPLIVALIVSRLGQIGGIISHFPSSANAGLREFGILLFIACVGLKAGGSFITTLVDGDGFYWMLYGVIITIVPLLLVGLYGKFALKMNTLTLWGVLSGSTTDPPALAFATKAAPSNAAAIGYATVYPAVMLCRVVVAQLIVLLGA